MSENRSELSMGGDMSLAHRVESCALTLMRSKGKFRDRLITLNIELGPLQPRSFTEEAAPLFEELKALVEKYRTNIDVAFGHFRDPTPADRKRIAELVLELYRLSSVATAKYFKE